MSKREGLVRAPVMKPVARRMSVDTTISRLDRDPEVHKLQFEGTPEGFADAMRMVKSLLDEVEGEQSDRFEIVVYNVAEGQETERHG